jgi:patatin-like phospholipase/acyl hydrolase
MKESKIYNITNEIIIIELSTKNNQNSQMTFNIFRNHDRIKDIL